MNSVAHRGVRFQCSGVRVRAWNQTPDTWNLMSPNAPLNVAGSVGKRTGGCDRRIPRWKWLVRKPT